MGTGASGLFGDTEIDGEVVAVVFENDATGFGVVEVDSEEYEEVRAAGPLAGLVPGQPVRLRGTWTEHERYGPTFSVTVFEQSRPRSPAALVTFLSSERFPGVGRTRARRIVSRFGLQVPDVLEREPERLAEVEGISPRLASGIAQRWNAVGTLAGLVADLAGAGLPASVAQAVYRHLGDDAPAVLAADPYAVLSSPAVGWKEAELLARAAGVAATDPRRLAAAAVTAQRGLSARGGHLGVDPATLEGETSRLLRRRKQDARQGMRLALERGTLVVDPPDAPDGRPSDDVWWYTPADLAAERHLADDLARLTKARSRVRAATGDLDSAPELTVEQASAVRAALTSGVSVLTGGPGTGKTRTVVEIVRACEEADLHLALCAPTGRAAKRISELTGSPASTIHRLLEARGVPGEGFRFGYDHRRRLPHDVVVVDEWSMADVHLARALVRAVPDGAHLVMVGDADQLPSVGPGAVLRDLTDPRLAGLVTATRLTTIHRQAAASRIVTLAHEVNAGEVGVVAGNMGDVFAVPERTGAIADRVAEIVAVRAPEYFSCTPDDVQVLAPVYRGPAGVDRLNARLKERLNPAGGRPAVAGFHEGDRVVQTRNDADLDVANGDVGEVAAVDRTEGRLEVAFPHGTVSYRAAQAGDLAPAWCLTVHKSQGGEWPVVVLVVDAGHRSMLYRELVYTGITRASAGLLLVGAPHLVRAAARRTGSGALHRRTRLTERLLDALGGAAASTAADAGHCILQDEGTVEEVT